MRWEKNEWYIHNVMHMQQVTNQMSVNAYVHTYIRDMDTFPVTGDYVGNIDFTLSGHHPGNRSFVGKYLFTVMYIV